MDLNDLIPAKQAAEIIGISYELLMARHYKGKIPGIKHGYAVFFTKEAVEIAAEEQRQRKPKD